MGRRAPARPRSARAGLHAGANPKPPGTCIPTGSATRPGGGCCGHDRIEGRSLRDALIRFAARPSTNAHLGFGRATGDGAWGGAADGGSHERPSLGRASLRSAAWDRSAGCAVHVGVDGGAASLPCGDAHRRRPQPLRVDAPLGRRSAPYYLCGGQAPGLPIPTANERRQRWLPPRVPAAASEPQRRLTGGL